MNTNKQEKRTSQTLDAIRVFSLSIAENLEKMSALPKIDSPLSVPTAIDIVAKKLAIYAEILPDVMRLRLCAASILESVDTETRSTINDTIEETQKVTERFFWFAELCRDISENIGASRTVENEKRK